MHIDTNTVVPISLANQADSMQAASDDDVLAASSKLMQRNKTDHYHLYLMFPTWFLYQNHRCNSVYSTIKNIHI